MSLQVVQNDTPNDQVISPTELIEVMRVKLLG